MQKTASGNYKPLDYLSKANMTWTSKPPSNEGLKRMGVKDRNFPKQVGSTVLTASGGLLAANGLGYGSQAISSIMQILAEGGTPEPTWSETVLNVQTKFNTATKVPYKPSVNAFIGLTFMKVMIGGMVNYENNDLLTADNFGANGNLSFGD